MKKILISDSDLEKLAEMKLKTINDAHKRFRSRKKCHYKDPRIKRFFENCIKDFNPLLYTIPFRCYFSFYLYLYLKTNIQKFAFDLNNNHFKISKPLDINFSAIKRLAGFPMGTIKSAYRELLKYGFLVFTEQLAPDKKNDSKCAMLLNDYYILEHDSVNNKTIFNIKLT